MAAHEVSRLSIHDTEERLDKDARMQVFLSLPNPSDSDFFSLSLVNKPWYRSLHKDPFLWKNLLCKRFGSSYNDSGAFLPGGHELPGGWTWVAGLVPDPADVGAPGRESLKPDNQDMLKNAADEKGAMAFTTSGTLHNSQDLPACRDWAISRLANAGTFVRASGAPEAHLMLPAFPGWRAYVNTDSPASGTLLRDPSMSYSLQHLAATTKCEAFRADGSMIPKLNPKRREWVVSSGWSALYVRDDIATAHGLPQPLGHPDPVHHQATTGASSTSSAGVPTAANAAIDWRVLYMLLSKPSRSAAREMSVAWLNNDYLKRKKEDASGSKSEEVVKLRMVWWLCLTARWQGVYPGNYVVIWRIRVDDSMQFFGSIDVTTKFEGTTEPGEGGEHANLPPVGGTLAHAVLQPRRLAEERGAHQWVEFEAGTFTLPAETNTTFRISSRLHNTDCNRIKGGLTFDCVTLRTG